MQSRTQLGKVGEDAVMAYLQNNGFTILGCNYRQRYGEVDLIAQKEDIIAFVEVKMRYTRYFDLTEVIIPSKQRKIIAVAKHYMATHKLQDMTGRFDVALVHATPTINVEYIPDAFREDDHL